MSSAPRPRIIAAGESGLRMRVLVLVLTSALAVVAASGIIATKAFSEPSLSKYAVTVAAPTLLALVALSRVPLRMLMGVCLFVAPLNFVTTLHGIQFTPFLAALILATVVAACSHHGRRMGLLGYASVVAGALLIPAIISASGTGVYALWLAQTLVMGWLVFVVASAPGGTRFVLLALVASIVIEGLLGVYEYYSKHQLNFYSSSGVSTLGTNYFFSYGSTKRYTGLMPDPIALGNVLALGLPLLVGLAVTERRRWLRIGLALGGAGASLGLILSLSRMSWIGGAVGTAFCLVLLPPRVRLTTGSLVLGTAAVVIILGASLGGSALRQRLISTLNPTKTQSSYSTTAAGDQLRVRLWVAAVRTAEAEPLTGTGFGNIVPALNEHGVAVPPGAHAQSWYFQILGEAGVLGGVALLCFIGGALRNLWVGFRRNRVLAAACVGSLIAVLLTWTTDIEPRYIQVSALIACLFGVIATLADSDVVPDSGLVPATIDVPPQ